MSTCAAAPGANSSPWARQGGSAWDPPLTEHSYYDSSEQIRREVRGQRPYLEPSANFARPPSGLKPPFANGLLLAGQKRNDSRAWSVGWAGDRDRPGAHAPDRVMLPHPLKGNGLGLAIPFDCEAAIQRLRSRRTLGAGCGVKSRAAWARPTAQQLSVSLDLMPQTERPAGATTLRTLEHAASPLRARTPLMAIREKGQNSFQMFRNSVERVMATVGRRPEAP